jgi:hypothetical protein
MNLPSPVRLILAGTAVAAGLLVQASCARSVEDHLPEPVHLPTEAVPTSNVCVATECPHPYATCEDEGLCTTDLRSDVDHCGACNAPCPTRTSSTHGTFLCSGGECRLACDAFRADCNNSTDDGCETATESDPSNCGACGNACDEDDLCWRGACGCPSGFSRCGDTCARLDSDNRHCGACGAVCRAPSDSNDPRWKCGPGVTPPSTQWSCASASCGLECKGGSADCNGNFCGDGCETDLLTDPKNCGACGQACGPGQWCQQGACACPPGTTQCWDECVDLQRDPLHCGACGDYCPGPSATRPGARSTGAPACENGTCTYVCFPGFADCDGSIRNGCETDLRTSQRHCGSCGNECEVAAGQPCVEGRCLTKTCDPPDPIR